jgi:transcriptional regulator with XRE-family HTH domain
MDRDVAPQWEKRAARAKPTVELDEKTMIELAEERNPNPIDVHVGGRIRMRRRMLGVSQEKLADALGLTFQQVQKYERGANRVSASKLYEIAAALKTPVAHFFEGLADPSMSGSDTIVAADASPEQAVQAFLMTPGGLEFAGLFPRLPRGRLRRRLLDLLRVIVGDDVEEEGAQA